MKKIHIKVTNGTVDAFEPGNPQGHGNVLVNKGESISWKHEDSSLPNAFVATFVNLVSGQQGWPFTPTDPTMRLRIPPGPTVDVKLDPAAATHWKYSVAVEPPSSIAAEDPMIIIRSSLQVSTLAFVALAGAVAGAVIAWFLLRGGMGPAG
jgi:hypothetical protein